MPIGIDSGLLHVLSVAAGGKHRWRESRGSSSWLQLQIRYSSTKLTIQAIQLKLLHSLFHTSFLVKTQPITQHFTGLLASSKHRYTMASHILPSLSLSPLSKWPGRDRYPVPLPPPLSLSQSLLSDPSFTYRPNNAPNTTMLVSWD